MNQRFFAAVAVGLLCVGVSGCSTSAISDFVDDVVGDIIDDAVDDAVDDVEDTVTTAVEDAVDDAIDDVEDTVTAAVEDAVDDAIDDAEDSIAQAVEDAVDDAVTGTATGGFDTLVTATTFGASGTYRTTGVEADLSAGTETATTPTVVFTAPTGDDEIGTIRVTLPNGDTYSFTDADFTAEETLFGASLEETVLEQALSGGAEAQLQLYTFETLDLDYVKFGLAFLDPASDGAATAYAAFAATITPDAPFVQGDGMPTTGTATYAGQTYGFVLTGDNPSFLGDVSATADFAAGTLSGSANDFAFSQDGAATSFTTDLDFSFASTISGAAFSGTTSGGVAGSINGSFAGPDAEELGATFFGTNSAGDVIGFIGAEQTTP